VKPVRFTLALLKKDCLLTYLLTFVWFRSITKSQIGVGSFYIPLLSYVLMCVLRNVCVPVWWHFTRLWR